MFNWFYKNKLNKEFSEYQISENFFMLIVKPTISDNIRFDRTIKLSVPIESNWILIINEIEFNLNKGVKIIIPKNTILQFKHKADWLVVFIEKF